MPKPPAKAATPTATTPYELVLRAARDINRLGHALDAEMMGSALLGSVYAIVEDGDRAAAVETFAAGFLRETATRRSATATTIRAVVAELTATTARPKVANPPWLNAVGDVIPTGSYAYGDVFGDQISYLTTFRYRDENLGGPEHAVVVQIDHNLGMVRDVFVTAPADDVVKQLRALLHDDPLGQFGDVAASTVRAEVERLMRVTDTMAKLPGDESLATDRALAMARLRLLPESSMEPGRPSLTDAERDGTVAGFLAESAAALLAAGSARRRESLVFCTRMIVDYAADHRCDVDPLRWSPAAVEAFLLEWVPRNALLDQTDIELLPQVLDVWVEYSARLRGGLPTLAVATTRDAITANRAEFTTVSTSGERRSPATTAMARLVAEGVDPQDERAVASWLSQFGDQY